MILLLVAVLAALVYGGVRLGRHWRSNHPKTLTTQHPRLAAAQPPPGQAPPGGWAVETHALTKRFGANVAVDHVELRVPRQSAFGYLGPNGAGKPVTEL